MSEPLRDPINYNEAGQVLDQLDKLVPVLPRAREILLLAEQKEGAIRQYDREIPEKEALWKEKSLALADLETQITNAQVQLAALDFAVSEKTAQELSRIADATKQKRDEYSRAVGKMELDKRQVQSALDREIDERRNTKAALESDIAELRRTFKGLADQAQQAAAKAGV